MPDGTIGIKLLAIIHVILMIGGKHDTMDSKAMEEQSKLVKKGRYLHCPSGSHLAMWDDQKVFMSGVIRFIHDIDAGSL